MAGTKPFALRARVILPLSQPAIEDGAVFVLKGRIAAIGRWRDLRRKAPARVHDLGEAVLLPGLINAHCHLDYTDMAGAIPPPRSFLDWIEAIIAIKAAWDYSDYAQSWLNGAKQLLRSGCTTVADIEAVPELLPEVWTATPLRVVSFLELISVRRRQRPGARRVTRRDDCRRVAVGRRLRSHVDADDTTRAGPVIEHELLPDEFAHLRRNDAEYDIAVAARRGRIDHADRLDGVRLRGRVERT